MHLKYRFSTCRTCNSNNKEESNENEGTLRRPREVLGKRQRGHFGKAMSKEKGVEI